MEDNTPSLKVQEAHTHKSGKLIPQDYVRAWLTSHNPTPRRTSLQPQSLFYSSLHAFRCGCCISAGAMRRFTATCSWGAAGQHRAESNMEMPTLSAEPPVYAGMQSRTWVVCNLKNCLMLLGAMLCGIS